VEPHNEANASAADWKYDPETLRKNTTRSSNGKRRDVGTDGAKRGKSGKVVRPNVAIKRIRDQRNRFVGVT
jgi:hypothetical protein